jgi:hypothetical protein
MSGIEKLRRRALALPFPFPAAAGRGAGRSEGNSFSEGSRSTGIDGSSAW